MGRMATYLGERWEETYPEGRSQGKSNVVNLSTLLTDPDAIGA